MGDAPPLYTTLSFPQMSHIAVTITHHLDLDVLPPRSNESTLYEHLFRGAFAQASLESVIDGLGRVDKANATTASSI